ncbi:MAG: hypothetical protein N3B11_07880 [Coriobacteriia bacterium]|nr:hypothetical protein [Coriobacteriia bacterium]
MTADTDSANPASNAALGSAIRTVVTPHASDDSGSGLTINS